MSEFCLDQHRLLYGFCKKGYWYSEMSLREFVEIVIEECEALEKCIQKEKPCFNWKGLTKIKNSAGEKLIKFNITERRLK